MTPEVLQAATGCRAELAALYAPHFAEACEAYQINTPKRLAAFLAQLSHESGSLRYTKEIWGPTPAQQRYEGRSDLGNVRPGDGERFKGHGLIQVTGRFNHAKARDRLRLKFGEAPDFEVHPTELTHPRWAVLSAADYWDSRNLNSLADADDFEAITKRINGGLNGQADRLERWERAKLALQVDTLPEPVEPVDVLPEPVEETPESVHVPYTPPRPDQEPYTQPEPKKMAFPLALVAGLLPSVVELIPSLSKIFKPGSAVAERNVAAASVVLDTVVKATNAVNAQDAIEKMKADPAALAAAASEVNAWVEMIEAGGGGLDGARKADAATRSAGDMLHSPSFWMALGLLLLVFWMMGNVMGLYGAPMDEKVRSAIINGAQGMILGGIVGYFFGQTTSRNRTPS